VEVEQLDARETEAFEARVERPAHARTVVDAGVGIRIDLGGEHEAVGESRRAAMAAPMRRSLSSYSRWTCRGR
jgi:hypothetical protein